MTGGCDTRGSGKAESLSLIRASLALAPFVFSTMMCHDTGHCEVAARQWQANPGRNSNVSTCRPDTSVFGMTRGGGQILMSDLGNRHDTLYGAEKARVEEGKGDHWQASIVHNHCHATSQRPGLVN